MRNRCFIIAEAGMTHDGSLGGAKAFIETAVDCGADAIKFQTHIADAETLRDAPVPPYFNAEPRYDYFKRTAFTLEQHRELKEYAEIKCGISFISSPFSLAGIGLLEKVGVEAYKVPSGEVTNTPYLITLAKTGKRIFLSSGMSDWSELDKAVETLRLNGSGPVVLLQCTSKYPCPPEDAGLNVMIEMRDRYKLPVGFSDHTSGNAIPVAAVVLGAVALEKHFTLSKRMYGPDAKMSAEPEEFSVLVETIRQVEKSLSVSLDKDETARSLRGMKVTFEKSVVAAFDLSAGTVLGENHLAYKKPGDGISASRFMELMGKTLNTSLKKDTKLKWEYFEEVGQ